MTRPWVWWWLLAVLGVLAVAARWERRRHLRTLGEGRWRGLHRRRSRWLPDRPRPDLREVLRAAAPDVAPPAAPAPAWPVWVRPVVDWRAAT